MAVGGVKGGTWGVDDTDYPKRMEIDYIRYYELINDDATDEVEDPNLIKNAGFEDAFEAGKEPSKGDLIGQPYLIISMNGIFVTLKVMK